MKSRPGPNPKHNSKILLVAGIVSGLCLVTLSLYFSVTVPSFSMWFYDWQYNANATHSVVNMQADDLDEVTRHMIRYMQGHLDRDYGLQIMTTVGGQQRYFFSDIEIRHMVDVYDLFAIGRIIRNIAAIVFVICAAVFGFFDRDQLRQLFRGWQIAAVSVFLGLSTLIVLIAINWHRAFIIFHEIFFDNDYWILDRRVDLLVNIVPYDFFITLSMVIGGMFAILLAAIFGFAALLKRRFD